MLSIAFRISCRLREKNKVNPHESPPGAVDFIYQHGHPTYLKERDRFPGPVITIVRNPLDYLVSAYHFFYRDRIGLENYPDHPFDLIGRLPGFAAMVKAFRALDGGRLISYEDLFEFPADTLAGAVAHYGLPVVPELVEAAARNSSLDAAREYEASNPPMHVGDPENWVPGYRFVRSGQIGQWKSCFSTDQVDEIGRRMARLGLPLSDFVLEPRVPPASVTPTDQ